MVLVSHKYKFIYIKNKKVAGSSVESFFGRYCLDPSLPYAYTDQIDERIDSFGIIGRRLQGKGDKWVSHKTAIEIKKELGEDKFNRYFKFCVIRNPWDKVVSHYFWMSGWAKLYNQPYPTFKEFVKKYNNEAYNWSIHTLFNKPICNFFIRFENLKEDIKTVCKKLKINDSSVLQLPTHKSTFRPSTLHYSKMYDNETKEIIYKKHKKEIKFFKYKFRKCNVK